MNKKFLIPLFAIMFVGSVFAVGYVVNNFVLKTDVYEPFNEVQFAVLGDAGNWDGVQTCAEYTGTWNTFADGVEVDMDGLYAGEGRKVCAKLNNLAEADIPYEITSEILNTNVEVYYKCFAAFGEPSVSGTVLASSEKKDGVAVVVSTSAEPVDDCRIKISVVRV